MDVNQIIQGDALSVLKGLPDGIAQTCVTSPPYYGLRDYQTETILQLEGDPQDCQHVWIHEGRNEDGAKVAECQHCFAVKVDQQIGLEETPDEYVAKLVAVFREVKRVLRNDGTLWLNLGDSYSGSGKGGQSEEKRSENWQPTYANKGATYPGLGAKQLLGIPWRVAFALQADGWILRSDIIWHKPNCMPESVEDRPTKSHEYLFLLSKSANYYYDNNAIREPISESTLTKNHIDDHGKGYAVNRKITPAVYGLDHFTGGMVAGAKYSLNPAGRNKRTVWTVASQPYSEAHFATFPPKLIEPCILAGTSPRACEHCGSSWERVTEKSTTFEGGSGKAGRTAEEVNASGKWAGIQYGTNLKLGPVVSVSTTGWQPTCTCSNEGTGKCIILDPFIGAGTTALVAIQHGRNYLGIDLNVSYVQLAEKRIATVQQNLWTSGSEAIAV